MRTIAHEPREHVKLTRKEYAPLQILAANAGLVVTHRQLMKEIWGENGSNILYLRVLVRKLRHKIEPYPMSASLIASESGIGYWLRRDADASSARKTISLAEDHISDEHAPLASRGSHPH